ncbi:MAG: DUF1565 domain-containing protein [Candidatus Eisenbacteria bacterium]
MSRGAYPLMLVALLTATPAFAQNGATVGTVELYPTLEAVGLRVSYTGDANANATAFLEWRPQGSGTWVRGVNLSRITGLRFAGSVMGLSEDTPYEARAIIEDPDGGGTATATVRTRKRLPSVPSGVSYYVAPNGNDANSGSSGSPFRTLTKAASVAQPGGAIRVRPGLYYELLDTPRSGTATNPIHLIAEGPGVILDGSDPAYLQRSDWRDDGGGIFSVPYTGTTRLVCADSLQRLYKQGTLAALQSNANGVAQGWAAEGGRLYVKLEDGSSPNGHKMHVARYDYGIFLDSNYWRVTGFEVRYFGTTAAASGVTFRGANFCELLNSYIFACAGRPVYMRVVASDNLVEGNLCMDPRIWTWPWAAVKSRDEEGCSILNRGGRGNVLKNNTVRGHFDGLGGGGDYTTENVASDADYIGNVIENISDDGIETDDYSAINVRVIGNRMYSTFNAISIAPITQGPYYCVRNLFSGHSKGGLKASLSSTGQVWMVHNTFSGGPAVYPSGTYSNMHFRNNIFSGSPPVSDDAGESATGNDFDGELLHSVSSTIFRWKGINYSSISSLRSATGFEVLGRVGNPLFLNPAGRDFTLASGSPAVDAAIRMPGFNDLYSGAAPDIGAFELGGPDVTPPAGVTDLRTD